MFLKSVATFLAAPCFLVLIGFCAAADWFDGTSKCPGFESVQDFKEHAKTNLDQKAYNYIASGSILGNTKKNNRDAFNRLFLRPRFMIDISNIELSTFVLGSKVKVPLGVSPAAAHQVAHPDGELATVQAVSEAGAIMIVSCFSTILMEEVVARASPDAVLWFQVHIFPNRSITQDLVRRAEQLGIKAISVGIDFPEIGIRYQSKKDKYYLPQGASYVNFKKYDGKSSPSDATATWKDIQWLKSITNLPIVIKGVLTVEDAVLAVRNGASGIIVSNHGGRQLDSAPATIDVLPGIAHAIGPKTELYLDSGVRTGVDVLKALALGAKAVFIGRPLLYGISYRGAVGGKCVLDILRNELSNAMKLSGVASVNNMPLYLVSRSHSHCHSNSFNNN